MWHPEMIRAFGQSGVPNWVVVLFANIEWVFVGFAAIFAGVGIAAIRFSRETRTTAQRETHLLAILQLLAERYDGSTIAVTPRWLSAARRSKLGPDYKRRWLNRDLRALWRRGLLRFRVRPYVVRPAVMWPGAWVRLTEAGASHARVATLPAGRNGALRWLPPKPEPTEPEPPSRRYGSP